MEVTLTINGGHRTAGVPANRTLLELLRELGHSEVKCGCEKGDCGACAVLMDGEAVVSCLVLAWQAAGRTITTVAGLGDADDPHPLQSAFVEAGAIQCGYCTPGMIIAAKALLDRTPDAVDEEIRAGLAGNLCRCTGYTRILAAVRRASVALKDR